MKDNKVVDYHKFILKACTDGLGAFCSFVYPDFQMPTHIKLLLKKLRGVEEGKIKRLIINIAPRHGKTQLVSKLFPSWYLGKNPKNSVIFTTYGQDLADDVGRVVRNIINSDQYKQLFPQIKLAQDSSSIKRFALEQGGTYFAVGAGGALTGRGGDLIIIDDILRNRQDANSQTIRKNIIDWFNSTLYTRLSPGGAIVLIQTRWHAEDLTGYLIETQKDKWEILSLPAIDENNNPLWGERWSYDQLIEIKKAIGTYEWSALYQQNPVPSGGNIIKYEWIRTYKELPHVKMYSWSWDTAIKAGQENDYSVGTLWALCDDGYYLINLFRQKIEYPELRKIVNMLYNKQKSSEVLIEDKASGQQILQDFKRIGTMPIIAMTPGKEMPAQKEIRMQVIAGQFEAGKVFIPEDAEWAADFVTEMTHFPSGKHDDICDSTSQYLIRRLNLENKKPNIRML